MRFSVVLNTFNRAHFLPRVLRAWARLPAERFTMLIADDGSEDDTDAVIRRIGAEVPFQILHVKHARQGHRRAEILNKAVAHAVDDAILFTDADSLPAKDLLDVHARYYSERRLLAGGYLRLTEDESRALDEDAVARGEFERCLTPEAKRALTQKHLKHSFYCWMKKRGRPHIMGLNMVVPRSGFVAVNGYDNAFRGWGRADGDLRERLKEVGVWPRSDWNEAIVFHLWHPEDPTKEHKQNAAYSERADIPTVAENGFEQCIEEARGSVVFDNRA